MSAKVDHMMKCHKITDRIKSPSKIQSSFSNYLTTLDDQQSNLPTNKQTNKQTNQAKNMTSLAQVIHIYNLSA